ncbi:MAG: lamin tail domain-containing protein, partial [Chloroflexi bacterium]|nr:lamin tail domain-containing protein [Chloroflexota bacterium]
QGWLRISEGLPDPPQSGSDADSEWVEIVNLGPGRVSMEGMRLVDNRASTALPAVNLDAGDVVVIAAPLAAVATAVRVPMFGNGLGNTGDTLALVSAAGDEVDRLAYGDSPAHPGVTVLPAPGAGRSIERWFSEDGVLLGARVSTTPTPGVYLVPEDLPAGVAAAAESGVEAGDSEPRAIAGATGPGVTWVVLVALAAGMLGGAAMQHGSAMVRERRAARPAIEPTQPLDVAAAPAVADDETEADAARTPPLE